MENATMTERHPGRLQLRWVPVTDRRGRTHMEARWTTAEQVAITHHAA